MLFWSTYNSTGACVGLIVAEERFTNLPDSLSLLCMQCLYIEKFFHVQKSICMYLITFVWLLLVLVPDFALIWVTY